MVLERRLYTIRYLTIGRIFVKTVNIILQNEVYHAFLVSNSVRLVMCLLTFHYEDLWDGSCCFAM